MDQPSGLEAARQAFVDAVTNNDARATRVSRETAESTAKSICKLSNVCTNANIQHCKSFILPNILTVPSRTAALREYLISLSKSFCPRHLDTRVDTTKPGDENAGLGKIINGKVQQPPQPAFKRLHLLYLLHDILMHVYRHGNGGSNWSAQNNSDYAIVIPQLRPIAHVLARLAACGCTGKSAKTVDLVLEVVSIWKAEGVFSSDECDDVWQDVKAAADLEWENLLGNLNGEDAKARARGQIEDGFNWVMPYRHCVIDHPNAPWHELPAANGLYIKRTRGFPLRAGALPLGGFELDNAGREADEELKQDLTALYRQIKLYQAKYTEAEEVQDIDALGNIIWKDADRPTRNYWGWTLDGIETRKELAAQFAQEARGYDDLPQTATAGVNSAVERARALAAARNGNGGGMPPDEMAGYDLGRGGFRGRGNMGGFRGGYRGEARGGSRPRARW